MRKTNWLYLTLVLVMALAFTVSCQQAAAPAATATKAATAAATTAPVATAAATKAATAAATTAPTAAATKAATAAATVAATAKPASGPNIDRIKKAGKLVVLMDATFRPMEYKDEAGKIVGFDVDMADAFAKYLGVTLEAQNINWDGIFVGLVAGKGDMIQSSVTITDDRKKEMSFSQPYYQAGQVIAIPAGTTNIKGPNDLVGKTVAVQIDTTGQEAAEKITGIKEIRKFDGGAEVMLAVEQKKVEAAVLDVMVVLDYIKTHPNVTVVDRKPFTTEDIGVAFQKDATDLVQAYNAFLAQIKQNGTYNQILAKWGLNT
ncbi:MAG: basic amino acid ABC transporter substrate-binding protein [Chloroflexota bacterium]